MFFPLAAGLVQGFRLYYYYWQSTTTSFATTTNTLNRVSGDNSDYNLSGFAPSVSRCISANSTRLPLAYTHGTMCLRVCMCLCMLYVSNDGSRFLLLLPLQQLRRCHTSSSSPSSWQTFFSSSSSERIYTGTNVNTILLLPPCLSKFLLLLPHGPDAPDLLIICYRFSSSSSAVNSILWIQYLLPSSSSPHTPLLLSLPDVCMYVYTLMRAHACVHACVCMCVYVSVYVYVYVCVCGYACALCIFAHHSVRVCACVYVCHDACLYVCEIKTLVAGWARAHDNGIHMYVSMCVCACVCERAANAKTWGMLSND